MRSKILTVALILILIGVIFMVINLIKQPKVGNLVSAGLQQDSPQKIQPQSSPTPTATPYNPPKEIKYSQSTDLQKELDSVNPEVLNSDFDSLKN